MTRTTVMQVDGNAADPETGNAMSGSPYKAYVALATQELENTNTSGLLIVGRQYWIGEYLSGDDFTNVGASANETGQVFTATGTIPANWSNGSSLTRSPFFSVSVMNKNDFNYLGDIVWADRGNYQEGTLAGAFIEGKTFPLVSNNIGGSVCFSISIHEAPDSVVLVTEAQSTDGLFYGANSKLNLTPIEIRVYQ